MPAAVVLLQRDLSFFIFAFGEWRSLFFPCLSSQSIKTRLEYWTALNSAKAQRRCEVGEEEEMKESFMMKATLCMSFPNHLPLLLLGDNLYWATDLSP